MLREYHIEIWVYFRVATVCFKIVYDLDLCVIVGDICSFVWVIKKEFIFFTDALQYGLYAYVWVLR